MSRNCRLFVMTMMVCALPLAATAQDTLGKRVSLDLKAMAPAEAFKVLAESIGMTVTVDPAVTAPVDIVVRNVSARTALNTICESIACRWTSDAAGITVRPAGADGGKTAGKASRPPGNADRVRGLLGLVLPAGLKFENASIPTVSARLSEATRMQIAISCDDPAVQTITADVGGMTVQKALGAIMDREQKRGTTWRITFTGTDGQKPSSFAIMVARGKAKK